MTNKKSFMLKVISKSFLSKWIKNENGVVAIEFSLLIIPYLMLVFGIVELAMMYSSASMLERATSSASRLVRTGQVQQAANPEEAFLSGLCDNLVVFVDCADVQIEVVPMDNFSSYDSVAMQYDEDGVFVPRDFDAGGSKETVLIRAVYRYSMITPLVGSLLTDVNGERVFVSTIVLQVEPYEFDAGV